MKIPDSLLSRIIFAYLPFMVYAFDLEKAWIAVLCVVAVFWLTVFFFWFTRNLFPEKLRSEVFFFWLLAWAQAVWYFTKLQPLWALSVFFLIPTSFLEPSQKASRVRVFSRVVPRYFWERFLAGFGFIGFVIVMALVQEVLGRQFGMMSFQRPAGILLLLSLAAFLWKNQPYQR
ncbi:MAG TPA: hypothetical protein PLO78_03585 [Candidatus Omnitrophota bacterium]|nr:hypothetical protein [Candidatus Omnitrophota bacterium]